jgi:hypothetical protein
VIWSGTWEYSSTEIAAVVSAREQQLLILATEKNVDDYLRIADVVHGNLYYWSSVNPEVFPAYPQKLIDMGNAVREHGGIWIAPAAPGFDARLLGGEKVVERQGGATLRAEWEGALASVPHAIGIISWNEFSENTHIEPSIQHGNEALRVVADLTGAPRPSAIEFDSSGPMDVPEEEESPVARIVAILGLGGVMAGSLAMVRRRQLRELSTARDEDIGPT